MDDLKGAIKTFLKGIRGILKNALVILVIQAMLSFFSVILMVGNASWLIMLLSILSGASFFAILYFIGKSSAYSDFQVYKNNLIRLKNGDYVSRDRLISQYRWFYGYLTAFIPSGLFILFAVAGIFHSHILAETNVFGKIAFFVNIAPLVPIINAGAPASLYFSIVVSALVVLTYGTGYLLHGIKLKLQYEELQRRSGLEP
jgi:hypothetical protein